MKGSRLKTRPDLFDADWLKWLSDQPENRGIKIWDLFERMVAWCTRKGAQPTRRRLLVWLENERSAIPIISIPKKPAAPEPAYTCQTCFDEGVVQIRDASSPYSWALTDAPCPTCSKTPQK